MAEQEKKVVSLEELKLQLQSAKAEVFDIMGEQEEYHRKMNGLQKTKMQKLDEVSKLRAAIKTAEEEIVPETVEPEVAPEVKETTEE